MYRLHISAIRLGLVLALSGTLLPRSAGAVPLTAFPPDVQRALQTWWARVPAEAKRQDLVAIRALSPRQAQAYTANLRKLLRKSPAFALQMSKAAEQVREALPPAYRQRYVNGMWGVSPADVAFSRQINATANNLLRSQMSGSGPGSNSDIQQRLAHIRELGRRGQGYSQWQNGGRDLANALGGQSTYHDSRGNLFQVPIDKIPNASTGGSLWSCPSLSSEPISSRTPPNAVDCQPLAPGSR